MRLRELSNGLAYLSSCLDPNRAPEGEATFPPKLDKLPRRTLGESARAWLRELIGLAGGRITSIGVEPNLAIAAKVKWRRDRILYYANIQILRTSATLEDFLASSSDDAETQYLRLDFDPNQPGAFLKEPQPHVHVVGEGEPRFPVPELGRECPVGWFIDFVYRNFFYDVWIDYAESLWSADKRTEDNRWASLKSLIEKGEIGAIEANALLQDDLQQLKAALDEQCREFVSLRTSEVERRLLGA